MVVNLVNEIVESIVFEGVKEWVWKIGFGSYGKFVVCGDMLVLQVVGIVWDLMVLLYVCLFVLVSVKGVRFGFFVGDISFLGMIE